MGVNTSGAPGGFDYADAVSGAAGLHVAAGQAVLEASGGASVDAPVGFSDAASLNASAVVVLTPVNAAMPNLTWQLTAVGFDISGGAAGGTVGWILIAPRKAFGTAAVASLAGAAGAGARRGVLPVPAV